MKPELVAEIAFAEFTADKVVRHASFLGLRGDKKAKEVVAEMPQALPEPAQDDVKISNPDRVIFPDAKVTKGELAEYYRDDGRADGGVDREPADQPGPLPAGARQEMLLPEA